MDIFENFIEKFQNILTKEYNLKDYHLYFDYNTEIKREGFGDFSTNIALLLAKKIKKNPLEIAEKIKKNIENIEEIKKVEIMHPGFLNITFNDQIYKAYFLRKIKSKEDSLSDQSKKKYNIEFISANPTGPLHVGHGRGGIIGDTLGKIFKSRKYQVTCEYYINDAGSQIEKLGKSVFYKYKNICGINTEPFEDGYKGSYIEDLAQEIYEKYDKKNLTKEISWFSEYAKNIMLEKIKTTALDYNIHFDLWFSEKSLHSSGMVDSAIQTLLKNDNAYKTDDGVIWLRSTRFGDEKDRVLKKSDGSWTYTAGDLAYLIDKIKRGYTDIIMILGQDHHSFKVRMEAITQALGFPLKNFKIILYQLVTLKNDTEILRMSKRKGNSVYLQNVIDTVGTDVTRFFYLQRKRDAHLTFDIKEALKKNQENPVFYIQYAYVRIKSILQKYPSKIRLETFEDILSKITITENEKRLLKKIALFDKTIETIVETLEPHYLTYYTIELAQLFHVFYTNHSVISNSHDTTIYRIGILLILKNIFEKCAILLGITYPEQM